MSTRNTVLAFAVIAAGGLALAAAGAWDATSPHYWRHHAQTAALAAAGTLAEATSATTAVGDVTRFALRLQPGDVTGDEMAQAARLMERARQPRTAATLWLGLTRLQASDRQLDAARQSAEQALAVAFTQEALLALLVVTRSSAEQQAKWYSQLQTHFPNHELSLQHECVRRLQTFTVEPPAVCNRVAWVRTHAWGGRREDIRLAQAILDLPQTAARRVAAREQEIAAIAARQPAIATTFQEITRERDNLGYRAFGEFVVDLLPLPKRGDTLESYAVRETACVVRFLRWGCIVVSAGTAIERMEQAKKALDGRLSDLAAQWKSNESSIAYAQSDIRYWSSSSPLQSLLDQRSRLLDAFRARVADEVAQRYAEPGLEPNAAILTAIGAR